MEKISALTATSGSTRSRAVYIIRRVHVFNSCQSKRSSRGLLLVSAILVVSPTDNDDGMLWYIVSGRYQRSLVWKRSEIGVKKNHHHLKQIGDCSLNNAWIDRFAQKVTRSLDVEGGDISTSQLAHRFCLRMARSLLGACSETAPFSWSILPSTLKNDYALSPAVFVPNVAKRSLAWEFDWETENDTNDASEAGESDSIISKFDHASGEDFDPGYISDDSSSDASGISILSDLGGCEDEDDQIDDMAYDEEDDLDPSHASCCQRRYERVRVMSAIWDFPGLTAKRRGYWRDAFDPDSWLKPDDSPVTVDEEMREPMKSFEAYRYEIEKFTIPSTLPTRRLQENFQRFGKSLRHKDSKTLLIFWYNGHGDIVGPEKDLLLCGHKTEVYWKDIVAEILSLPCDVLVILDCCHAGAFVQGEKFLKPFLGQNRKFIKEVLCTAGFERTTRFGKRYSLAPVLSKTLNAYRQRGGLHLDHLFRVLNYELKKYCVKDKDKSNTLVLQRLISGRPGTLQLHPLPDPRSALTKKRLASFTFPSCEKEPPRSRQKLAKSSLQQKWICVKGRWEVAKAF